MTTHRIDLGRMTGPSMTTVCHYLGDEAFRSRSPIYDGARWLLDNGHAEATDTLSTYRDGVRCMSGIVGRLADWTVAESDRVGLRLVPWATVEADRSRLAVSRADGRLPRPCSAVGGQTVSKGTFAPLGHGMPSLAPELRIAA